MEKIMFPDYKNNIIGISATLLEYCGVKNNYPKIKSLKDELKKNYKNVVFFVFDGLGLHAVKNMSSKKGFLNKNLKGELSSSFPPTTTAATSTYWSCSYPVEHSWLAWSLYLKPIDKIVDIFTNRETYNQEKLAESNVMKKYYPYESIFKKVEKLEKPKAYMFPVFPDYFDLDCDYVDFKNKKINQMFSKVQAIIENRKPKKKVVISYFEEPDSTMHRCGYSSTEAKRFIKKINRLLKVFAEKNPDTLIIVSADHGQIDVGKVIRLEDYPDILNCFSKYPTFESRAKNFYIKEDKKEEFVQLFNKYFGEKFLLLSKEEAFKKQIFGFGDYEKINDLLGDYIACAIDTAIFQYEPEYEDGFCFLGHHAGLLKQEMMVPLIFSGDK